MGRAESFERLQAVAGHAKPVARLHLVLQIGHLDSTSETLIENHTCQVIVHDGEGITRTPVVERQHFPQCDERHQQEPIKGCQPPDPSLQGLGIDTY